MKQLSNNWKRKIKLLKSNRNLRKEQLKRKAGVSKYCSVQFSCSVMSDSLWPHELQHPRPPCTSPTPGAYSNSCPSSRWCHPAISSSVVPLSSCSQSLPASGSFPMSQLFTWGGQSIGVSASESETVLFRAYKNGLWRYTTWIRILSLPAMQETLVWSLAWVDPVEEGMAAHSSFFAWIIPMDRGARPAAMHGFTKSWT